MTTTIQTKEQKLDLICYLFLVFLLGCLAGWIYEEVFYWITDGMLEDRGVLYGPWLPIYGVGTLGIYAMKPFKKHPAVIFLLSVGITGIVEYVVGRITIDLFNLRLWDYRDEFANFQGIVCLRSVVTFGIMGLMFHYLGEPIMGYVVNKLGKKTVHWACVVLACLFVLDCAASFLSRTPITY